MGEYNKPLKKCNPMYSSTISPLKAILFNAQPLQFMKLIKSEMIRVEGIWLFTEWEDSFPYWVPTLGPH